MAGALTLFDVYRNFRTPDGQGGFADSFDKIGEEWGEVALQTLTFRDRERQNVIVAHQERAKMSHIGYFRRLADIERGDKLVNRRSGNEYFVIVRREQIDPTADAEFILEQTQRGR